MSACLIVAYLEPLSSAKKKQQLLITVFKGEKR